MVLGLRIDERGFDASTFSKNRQRLLDHEVADRFFAAVVDQARLRRYCPSGHFSVDGTLLEAWASHKSFKPKAAPRRRRQAQVATVDDTVHTTASVEVEGPIRSAMTVSSAPVSRLRSMNGGVSSPV